MNTDTRGPPLINQRSTLDNADNLLGRHPNQTPIKPPIRFRFRQASSGGLIDIHLFDQILTGLPIFGDPLHGKKAILNPL